MEPPLKKTKRPDGSQDHHQSPDSRRKALPLFRVKHPPTSRRPVNGNSKTKTTEAHGDDTQEDSASDVSLSSDMQALSTDPELLDHLLAPLSTEVFLRDCFRQRAVYNPAQFHIDDETTGLGQLLRQKLFDLQVPRILQETSSDSVFVWLTSSNNNNNNTAPATSNDQDNNNSLNHGRIHSIEVADAETALALYRAGHATYCRAPPSLEQYLVSSLLLGTGLGCGQYDSSGESITCMGRGEVEVFVSTSNHVTDWHYDFQENFTLQISGRKRWTLQAGSVSHPLRGCTPHYQSPGSVEAQLKAAHLADPGFQFDHPKDGVNAVGERDVVIMEPGDVLYFPAGMWHKVEVLEPGISINISLMATTYANITCQALQHLLLKKDEWRECVTMNSTSNVVDKLRSLLKELPSIIEQFEKQGGAEAIVPPVLFSNCRKSNEKVTEKDDEAESGDEEAEMVDEEDGDSSIVEIGDGSGLFSSSEEELKIKMSSHSVMTNPLACLLREDEVTSFYGHVSNGASGERDSNVFLLNVNYAGNEGHESVARTRIQDRGSLLKAMHTSKERWRLPPAKSWIHSAVDRAMIQCLTHYGYLVWSPKDK